MSHALRWILLALFALMLPVAAARGESIRGAYFQVHQVAEANSPSAPTGDRAVLAWSVKKGAYAGARLDGLAVAAVISTEGPMAIGDQAHARTTLLVDARADAAQQAALVQLAHDLAEGSLGRVTTITPVKIDLRIGEGCAQGYVAFHAGQVQVRTRRVLESDPATRRNAPGAGPILARTYYSYRAVPLECSCSLSGAQEPLLTPGDSPMASAAVGGFSL